MTRFASQYPQHKVLITNVRSRRSISSYGVDTSSEESPLFQELAKSPLFQELEKIQSILKEYFSGPATPHESRGLRKFMNKSPCTTSTEESATKKWDFACTRKGGISPEYVSKYIKLVFKFYHFLDNYYQTVNYFASTTASPLNQNLEWDCNTTTNTGTYTRTSNCTISGNDHGSKGR